MNITNIHAKTSSFVTKNVVNDNFVKDLAKIPLMSAQEEYECFMAIQESKDRVNSAKNSVNFKEIKEKEEKLQLDIRNKIIAGNQRLNYAAAKRYDNNEIVMELVSVGTMGMIEAFEEYNINKGVRFCTYAMYYIRRAINAFLTKENLCIKSSSETKYIPKVKKIENEFFMREGYYPSTEELKDILLEKYNISNVDAMDLISAEISSIDAPITTDDENYVGSMDESYNTKTAVQNDYIEEYEMDAKRELINNMFKTLNEREKIILSMSMGYNFDREYKDNEISFELGLSTERVRQIKLGAIKKLQKFAAIRY